MKNPIIRSLIITLVIALIVCGVMVLEMNQLSAKYKQTGQLIMYVAVVFFAIVTSVMVSTIMFYRNRKNPRMTAKKAKLSFSFFTIGIAAVIYIIPNFIFKASSASCIQSKIFAIVTDPMNQQVCLNIKSVLFTKIFSFTKPLFIGQIFTSALIVIAISLAIYAFVTSKFLYKGDR